MFFQNIQQVPKKGHRTETSGDEAVAQAVLWALWPEKLRSDSRTTWATWCFHLRSNEIYILIILRSPAFSAHRAWRQRTLCNWGELRVAKQKGAQKASSLSVFQVTLDHFSTKPFHLQDHQSTCASLLHAACCCNAQGLNNLTNFEHPCAMLEYSEYHRISQNYLTHRIHGAAIYANMTGVYWW
jgi:hypothetical protein